MTKQILFIFLILVASSVFGRGWDPLNDPKVLNVKSYKLAELALKGHLKLDKNGPWSGFDWPYRLGSLDYHYNPEDMSALEKWEKLTQGEAAYDIRSEIEEYISEAALEERELTWDGLCHGYSATSLQFSEPKNKEVDGVNFLAADIKGLLAFYYDDLLKNKNFPNDFFIGRTCRDEIPENLKVGDFTTPECDDVNPGAFHLALVEKLANAKTGFVMDNDRGPAIYNYPVVGYESIIKGDYNYWYPVKAAQTNKIVEVETTISYLDVEDPLVDSNDVSQKQKVATMRLSYTLELNSDGEIVGGEWISYNRPDFIWMAEKIPTPSGKWEALKKLLN